MAVTHTAPKSNTERRAEAEAAVPVIIDAADQVSMTVDVYSLDKALLLELIGKRYGYAIRSAIPGGWTQLQMAACAAGNLHPRSLDALRRAMAEKFNIDAPKTWAGKDMWAMLTGRKELPKSSKAVKAAAVEQYKAKFGVDAPKSYTAEKMRMAIAENKPTAGKGGKRADGLTAVHCKELLKAARANGTEVPAYSKLKADELRALVGQLGLSA